MRVALCVVGILLFGSYATSHLQAGKALAATNPGLTWKHAQSLRAAAQQCRDNIRNGEMENCIVEDTYEGDREMSIDEAEEYAAKLGRSAVVEAIHSITASGCPCNMFVSGIGMKLGIPYFDRRVDDARLANQMYDFISGAVGSPPSGWRRLSPEDAEEFAEQGRFVIGVAKNRADGPGHIVIAVSSTLKRSAEPGNLGPWLRDGQNPFASVRASSRFGRSVTDPIWALWR